MRRTRTHAQADPQVESLAFDDQVEHYKRVATTEANTPKERWDHAFAYCWLDEHEVPGFIRPKQPKRPTTFREAVGDPPPEESEFVRIEVEELRRICEFFARVSRTLPPRRSRKGGAR